MRHAINHLSGPNKTPFSPFTSRHTRWGKQKKISTALGWWQSIQPTMPSKTIIGLRRRRDGWWRRSLKTWMDRLPKESYIIPTPVHHHLLIDDWRKRKKTASFHTREFIMNRRESRWSAHWHALHADTAINFCEALFTLAVRSSRTTDLNHHHHIFRQWKRGERRLCKERHRRPVFTSLFTQSDTITGRGKRGQ